ncbi:carbohydrate ABC transporter permease [Bacillus sp. USDA818B3_A]|uniref:carbohydrate ABC transporter permease n=1 Tax=Bacillus sp. USDA818B3_A TaxID=2698834 RepID=UPI0019250DB2|nr:carbohydrate ABC transporter permease [Bacillus sp. USDA818B3_A]
MSKKIFNSESMFQVILFIFLTVIILVTLLPFWNIFVISINNAQDTVRGGLYFWPRVFSLESYKSIFADREILTATKVTVLRTVIGTPLSLLVITMLAYALSKRDLVFRKPITLLFIFTMFFSGGLIPYYMVLKSVHLIDSFWVYIIPGLMSVFNMILIRTFIEQLPKELEEAAKVEGANDVQIFFKIIIPLSKPILATIGLFIAIGHWNSWFDSYVFTYKPELKTLQAVLVKILNQYQTGGMMSDHQQLADSAKRMAVSPDSLRMAATMVVTIPIMIVYPFLQKYFAKGMMVGSIKE